MLYAKTADLSARRAGDAESSKSLVPGIGIAAHPSRRPLRGLLRMRSNLLKHNNLMLRSERRERLEAWAASDLPISHSQYYVDKLQCRLNRFLFTPAIISMKDNLVSGTAVAEPPPAAAGALANGGWLDASLGPCRLVTFRRFLSTSISVGGGPDDAYDRTGDGSLGAASANSVGGSTIVGWLVSMMMRSGGC